MEMRRIRTGHLNRVKWYASSILGTLIPSLIFLGALLFWGEPLSAVGLKNVRFNGLNWSHWIAIPLLVVSILYVLYNIYSLVILAVNPAAREQAAKSIPPGFTQLLPVSLKEKGLWIAVSTNAGITEEFLFRGMFFFLLVTVFPELHPLLIVLISSVLFGLGHIYQGMESVKTFLLGLFFGTLYLLFDSILPGMLIHAIQDMVVVNLAHKPEGNPSVEPG